MAGVELATAYIALVPSAAGIAANISKEMGGPLEDAASEAGTKSSGAFAAAFAVGAAVAAAAVIVGLEKIGSSFDDASDKIRTTTGATGTALDGLEASFKSVVSTVPVDFGDASDAIAGLNQRLGLTGKPLEDLATQVLNLSRITGTDLGANVEASAGLFNSWGIAAADQGPKLDELFRISQATGISVTDLATQMTEGGVKLRSAGLDFESSGALLGLLAKNGLSASDVMPALSKSMATAAASGKDAKTVFQETFDAIKNAPNDTEAAGIALDVFGAKAGPQFSALIREGKLSYEDLAATIAGGGDTINQAAADTDDWREKLKLLMNKGMVALEPIATKVFNAIGTVVQKVTPFLLSLAAGFKTALGWLMDHKEVLIGAAIGVGAVLVAMFVSWAAAALPAAAATIAAAAPFIALGAAVAAVAAGFMWAYDNVGWFRTGVDVVASFLKDTLWPILQDVFGWLRDNVPPIISAVIDGFKWGWENVLAPIGSFLTSVFKVAWDVTGIAIDVVRAYVQVGIDIFKLIWHTVLEPLATFLSAVFRVAWDVAGVGVGLVRDVAGFLIAVVKDLWYNFLSPIASFMEGAFTTAWGVALSAIDLVKAAFGLVVEVVKDLWYNVLSPVIGFLEGAFKTGFGVAKTAIDTLKVPLEKVVGFLQNIIDKAKTAIDWLAKLNPFDGSGALGGIKLPTLPSKAHGAIVPAPMAAIIGDAPGGEAVLNRPQVQDLINWAGISGSAGGAGGGGVHVDQVIVNNDTDADAFFRIANFHMAAA